MRCGAPLATAKMTVILLHGYGSCGANMVPLAQALDLREVAFWCPDGPESCGEYPQGRQWFSLRDMDWRAEDLGHTWYSIQEPLKKASENFAERLRDYRRDFSGPVVLAGFSQGAMMAYELGFFGPKIHGVMGLAGAYYLDRAPSHRPPILWTHCADDGVVPLAWMRQSHGLFLKHDLEVQSSISDVGGHGVSPENLLSMGWFLRKMLE